MATNEGAPITPARVGLGGLKAIVAGTVQIAQALAIATTTKTKHGVSLAEVRVRAMALGAYLTARPIARGDLTFMARHAGTARGNRHGVTHVCAHKARKGAIEQCVGGHDGKGESCAEKFEFRSAGDGVTRWRNTPNAHEPPAFDSDASATVAAARATMRGYVRTLAEAKFSAADMRATPSLAAALDSGLADSAWLPGKRTRKARAKRAAPVQAAADKATAE